MRSPVVVLGRFAFKFARNAQGRASNLYESKLYRSGNATRRALLCPVVWVSRNGFVQIMRAAKPLTEMMSFDEYMDVVDVWDYIPREDSCPFEPKVSDWGWLEGRMVALDYSPPAWEADESTSFRGS
ncbi:hypothetical protein ACVWZM_004153 [Bradyrhizobium sp. USDA 4501]